MSLLFKNVTYQYPNTQQGVKDVNLEIKSGELVAVIGPSGSGKSTLLKLVSGLTTGHSGDITLNARNLANTPIHTRNIGMVFQSYALFPHLSVLNNVAYGLKLRGQQTGERHAKAATLLDLVGLSEFADRSVSQLSGGQQQRVALARALAINPSALLLDEPLAALDASIRGQLRDQIRTLQKQFQATTLLVTHDQEEALTMADRVAVMKEGRVLQFGTPTEIYEKPTSKAVAEFVGLSSIFRATIVAPGKVDLGFCSLQTNDVEHSIGTEAWVLIRPEHIVVNPTRDAVNRLEGHTGIDRYLGSLRRFDFHVTTSSPVPVKPLLVESSQSANGAIAINPSNVYLLPT
jgi:putative spermidine/putrescine transport system ATP-binding protein